MDTHNITSVCPELLNKILSYLPFYDLKEAMASSKIFQEGAAYHLSRMAKPFFDVTLCHQESWRQKGILLHLKLLDKKGEKKRRFTLVFGQQGVAPGRFGLRQLPPPDNRLTGHPDDSQASLDFNTAFIKKFFPLIDAYPAEFDRFFEVVRDFFQNKARFRQLDVKESVSNEFCTRLSEIMVKNPAQRLFFNGPFWQDNSPLDLIKCVKEIQFLEKMTISEEFLKEICKLRMCHWVSINVDSWFDDTVLANLPLKNLPQLHFRGNHTVTPSGLKTFIQSWVQQTSYAHIPEIELIDPNHQMLAEDKSSFWVGERAFDCDLQATKTAINEITASNVSLYEEFLSQMRWPFADTHTIVEGPLSFVRIFYDIPCFNTGIRLVFFVKKP